MYPEKTQSQGYIISALRMTLQLTAFIDCLPLPQIKILASSYQGESWDPTQAHGPEA